MSRKSEMRIARRIIRYDREYQMMREDKSSAIFYGLLGAVLLIVGAWGISHALSMPTWPEDNLNLNASMTKSEWVIPNLIHVISFGGILAILFGMIFFTVGVVQYYHNIDDWNKIKNKYM